MTTMLSESSLQNKIRSKLIKEGWNVIKIIQLSKNGYPDLMALKNGKVIFIEVKRPKAKPRPLQLHRLKELTDNGFTAYWTDDADNINYKTGEKNER